MRIPRTMPRLVLASLLVCAATGCQDRGFGAEEDEVQEWMAEADLRVGSLDDETYALTWFPALEVDDSGRIYTLHPQEQLIRVFDSAGTVVDTIGGRGDGPGEFQSMSGVGWVADTLWVLDSNGYRFSLFSEEGELLRDFSVPFAMREDPSQESPPRANGLLPDGTVHGASPGWSREIASGELTHRTPVLMTPDGAVTDSLPSIPYGNSVWAVGDPDRPNAGGSYGSQPFGDGPLWSFVPGERAILRLDRDAPEVAEEATFTLTKLSFAGDTLFSRDYPFTPEPVRQAEVDSLVEARAQPLGEQGFLGLTVARAQEAAEQTLYRPAFKPHVLGMTVGRDGTVWLETRARPDSAVWMVLDPDGTPRGRVTLPDALMVLEAERSRLWGTLTDELDVPYLMRYQIRAPVAEEP